MMTLEQELSSALTNETVSAVVLNALIVRTEAAIAEADADAKRQNELIFDPQLCADPKEARGAMDDALLLVGRLNTLLTRLHRRRATAENAERVAAWNKDFGSMTERRDTLAAELVEAFSELSRVSEVFSRITIFEAELSRFHQGRPSGVPGLLLGCELQARGLQSFDRDTPSLLNQIKLFSLSGKAIWPPPQKKEWVNSIPVIEASYGGPNWWDKHIQEERQAQVKRESDRVTAYYAEQQRLREEREHQEDIERWKQV